MAFINEDHLGIHTKKQDLLLNFNVDIQNNGIIVDQTPTPTRFIRNCEEVGLFQDLQNVNPFDETFQKATELANAGSVYVPKSSSDDTLHTPHIFLQLEQENSNKCNNANNNNNILEFSVTTINDDFLKINSKEMTLNGIVNDMQKSNPHCKSKERLENVIKVISNKKHTSLSRINLINKKVIKENGDSDNFIEVTKIQNNSGSANSNGNENYVEHVKVQDEIMKKVKSQIKEALINKIRIEKPKIYNYSTMLKQRLKMPKVKNVFLKLSPNDELLNRRNVQEQVNDRNDGNSNNLVYSNDRQGKKKNEIVLLKSKLERQREINRIAQIRSRARKKKFINELEGQIKLLMQEKKELLLENQNLKSAVVGLKSVLLYHKNCSVSKDPQIMKEVHLAMKNAQDEPLKKAEKCQVVANQVMPIQPNPPCIFTLTPVLTPLLVQVPSSINGKNNDIKITSVPTIKIASNISASSPLPAEENLKPNFKSISQEHKKITSPSNPLSVLIGTNSYIERSIILKHQPNILKVKDKSKKNKLHGNIKANQNILLRKNNSFILPKPTKIEFHKNS